MSEKIKTKILIVDDEIDVTTSLQSILARRGYLVNTTASGKDALAIIKSAEPDLVLLDFNLPEMDGRDVLRELRKNNNKTKIIVITGHVFSSDEEMKEMRDLGICYYLQKPVILEELIDFIKIALGESGKKAELMPKADIEEKEEKGSSVIHKLSNLLGIIRNKCETYNLNIKDGIYQNKSKDEILDISVGVMLDSMENIDKAMEVVERIKKDR